MLANGTWQENWQPVQALEGIAETVNLDHIKAGYYSIKALNPGGIVPIGPDRL